MASDPDIMEFGAGRAGLDSVLLGYANPERFLYALFDEAPYGVLITRGDGIIMTCNRHFAEMLGYEADEIVGQHFNMFTHPDDYEVGLDVIRAVIAGNSSHATLEKRYVGRRGKVIWVHLSVGVIRNASGKIEHFVTTIDDITQNRAQKDALHRNEQRLQGLLEAIPYALFCVTTDGVCVYYKAARDRIEGIPESVVGKSLVELLPNEAAQTILDTVRAVLTMNEAFNVEYELESRQGVRHYEAHIAPYGTNEAIVLAIDITDRFIIERDRMEAQSAIISGQREVLRQISTPLMPIVDGVVAMPLVGPVDRERAQQMLSTLMAGVTSHHARMVIIDIAGVPNVDLEVAELLTRATQVVQLLGAEVLFAGIRPDVARNIIALGVELTTFKSAGSFQSAIAMAMRHGRAR